MLQDNNNDSKRTFEDNDGNKISRKKMKKMRRVMRRPVKPEEALKNSRSGDICVNDTCPNPLVSIAISLSKFTKMAINKYKIYLFSGREMRISALQKMLQK